MEEEDILFYKVQQKNIGTFPGETYLKNEVIYRYIIRYSITTLALDLEQKFMKKIKK